jgi:HD-GYP domain-containing protein (c-di-GMP phosphodiesterase class II)
MERAIHVLHSAALSPAKTGVTPSELPWERDLALIPALQSIVAEASAAGTGARLVMAARHGDLKTLASERSGSQSWRVHGLSVLESGEPLARPGIAVAPVHGADGLRGAFLLNYDFGYVASQHEYIALAQAYASHVEEVLKASAARFGAIDGAAHAMMLMLAAHDPATARHSYIVRKLTVLFGRALELPAHELHQLEISALLHDVGKVGVPGPLLQKTGPLSVQDWALIRHHPSAGDQMVRSIDVLAPMAPAIRHHHERWDGNGYPDRLSGAAIPLHARLIGLADAYEAMRTGRPYQQPRMPEDVLDELRRSAGTQFDPSLVAILPSLSSHELVS